MMSKYDEDQAKYNQWAMYLLVLSIGYGVGLVSGGSSTEKERVEIYNSLPAECQKILEDKYEMEYEARRDE